MLDIFCGTGIERSADDSMRGNSLEIGFDSREFPALTAYSAAASVSKGTESGSGGTGALDNIKTLGPKTPKPHTCAVL